MQRIAMSMPKVFGDEETDTRATLEELGFIITDDTNKNFFETVAPDGWTIEWRGRDGAVFNKEHEAVIWLWKKAEPWEFVFTMRLHP